MKTKILFVSALCLSTLALQAQDTYDLARLSSSDLNGTARYVGMGGAMGALGGDLTAMNSNPAGLGIYRSNDLAVTASMNILGSNLADKTTRMSFDQIGVAFSTQYSNYSSLKYVNYGFNYRKRKNFFDNFQLSDNWNGNFSQTFQMEELTFQETDTQNMPVLPAVAAKAGALIYDEENPGYYGLGAYDTYYSTSQTGCVNEFDFSMGFNFSDQYFLGFSIGLHDARFNRSTLYTEYASDNSSYDMSTYYRTRGTGVNLKLGTIIRPIEDSNFRFGVAIETPTWYNLTDENGVSITTYDTDNKTQIGSAYAHVDPVDYEMITPWKFNLSLGTTLNTSIALGAEYEFTDYSRIGLREADGYRSTYTDLTEDMNKDMLKATHTFKVGAEFKPVPEISVRAGYNYTTATFDTSAYRDLYTYADNYIDTFTDTSYENTGAIHRLTCGVGFRAGQFYADAAFQYTIQKNDFYAFDDYFTVGSTTNYLPATSINKDRAQVMLTLGYKF